MTRKETMFATIGTLALLALTLPMDSKCSPIVSQKQNTLRSNVNSPPSQIRYSRFEVLPEYFRRNSRDKPQANILSNSGSGSPTTSESAEKIGNKKGNFLSEAYLVFKSRPPVELALLENSRYVLECEVSGSPLPRVHWERNGERIYQSTADAVRKIGESSSGPQQQLGLSMIKSRLYLDCLTPSLQGEYKCVATSEHQRIAATTTLKSVPWAAIDHEEETFGGNALDGGVKTVSEVDLARARCQERKFLGGGAPARIYEWTQTVLENIGQQTIIRCRASGSPKPLISWLANEKPIDTTTTISSEGGSHAKYSILPSGDLFIRNATFDDMGKYTCSATNIHGSDSIDKIFFYPTEPMGQNNEDDEESV